MHQKKDIFIMAINVIKYIVLLLLLLLLSPVAYSQSSMYVPDETADSIIFMVNDTCARYVSGYVDVMHMIMYSGNYIVDHHVYRDADQHEINQRFWFIRKDERLVLIRIDNG